MFRKVLASVLLGGALVVASFGTAGAAVPVNPSLTSCIFEVSHWRLGEGNVFQAADAAYAVQTTQANSYYVANYRGWVIGCHAESIYAYWLNHNRSAAEVAYLNALIN
jgi:hypothetical protein